MKGAVMLPMLASVLLAAAVRGEEPAPRIPPEHVPTYFERKPERFLVDPQNLLPAGDRREREKFLSYHSEDSAIDLRVLVFATGQVIPEDVRAEELAERFFGDGKPTVLALYFLGQPERARLQLSPELRGALTMEDLGRLRAQAVEAASARPGDAAQLEDFCLQMAIGIFWIERQAGLGEGPEAVDAPESGRTAPSAPRDRQRLPALLDAWWAEWGIPVSLLIGVVGAALLARVVLRRRARHRFPESLPPPRLGGERGAATGALIEFRSSTLSPSSQKGEPDDPLGGL